MPSSQKLQIRMNPNWTVMFIGGSSTNCRFFCFDMKLKMATTTGLSLTLDYMGKCSNAFLSETTHIIKTKLYMNVHWIVLYKL